LLPQKYEICGEIDNVGVLTPLTKTKKGDLSIVIDVAKSFESYCLTHLEEPIDGEKGKEKNTKMEGAPSS